MQEGERGGRSRWGWIVAGLSTEEKRGRERGRFYGIPADKISYRQTLVSVWEKVA